MSEVWSLPGYDVQSLLGYGASGEVWRAVQQRTGELVALKRLRPDADPAAIAALRREALVLQRIDSPYVVRLREVLGTDDATVLVLDLAEGGSLATLLARRGTLDPSEVVTLATPLARALAALHEQGLVHGDVTPANVLFTSEGMPLLSDLGLARFSADPDPVHGTAEYVDPAVAAGGLPGPASDVWALGAVCFHALTGTPPYAGGDGSQVLAAAAAVDRAPLGLLAPTVPRPLVGAIEAALHTDPDARPSAHELASSVQRAHAAAPLRLRDSAAGSAAASRPTHLVHQPVPAAAVPARRRPSRRLVAASVAAVVLAAAAVAGWAWGRSDPLPSTVLATPAVADTDVVDWADVLGSLHRARGAAFATANPAPLREVYAASSPALAANRAHVERLRARGHRHRDLRHQLVSAEPVSVGIGSMQLRVVDRLAPSVIVDRKGTVVRRDGGRGERAFVFDLVRDRGSPGTWRILRITPVPGSGQGRPEG